MLDGAVFGEADVGGVLVGVDLSSLVEGHIGVDVDRAAVNAGDAVGPASLHPPSEGPQVRKRGPFPCAPEDRLWATTLGPMLNWRNPRGYDSM